MDYLLNVLNNTVDFQELTLNEIINGFNLIGLEIDAVKREKNSIKTNIFLTFKIPSNREDLLIETFFYTEICNVFLLKIIDYWKKLKKKYLFLLKQNYLEYTHFNNKIISSDFSESILYSIECEISNEKNIPFWIKKKLEKEALEPKLSLIDNCFKIVNVEWSELLQFPSFHLQNQEPFDSYSICCISENEIIYDENNVSHILLNGTIYLKNNKNQLIAILGRKNLNNELSEKGKRNFEFLFLLNPYGTDSKIFNYLNSKFSLKKIQKIFMENFRFSLQRFLSLLQIFSINSIKITKYSNKTTFPIFLEKETLTVGKILCLRKNTFKIF